MKRTDLNSWAELEEAVKELQTKQRSNKKLFPRLLFRGQANVAWQLESTLERQKGDMQFAEYYRLIAVIQSELESFTQNQWQIPGYTEILQKAAEYDFLHLNSDLRSSIYGYMAHLRHHGFPSPLLDWTRSLQIAGYFAFARATPDQNVSIYALSESKSHSGSSNESQIFSFGPNVRTHRRHFLQQCEYTMCADFKTREWRFSEYKSAFEDWPDREDYPTNFALYRFTLPGSIRSSVLEILDQSNINAYSLFGSEEALLETLALRHFTFTDPFE